MTFPKYLVGLNEWAVWFFGTGLIIEILIQIILWRRDLIICKSLQNKNLNKTFLTSTPSVSVLVPAWNEANLIEKHIQSYLELRYPNKELILCAGGQDGTFELADRYRGGSVSVLQQYSGEGKQKALHRCLQNCSGDIIFLADADGYFDDFSFEGTLKPLIEDNARVVSGMTKPLPTQFDNPFVLYQWAGENYSSKNLGSYTTTLRGCNAAIYRNLLELAGGFADTVSIGTDAHLGNKLSELGIKIHFVQHSQMANKYPSDYVSYVRQQSRWLRVAFYRRGQMRKSQLLNLLLGYFIYISPLFLIIASVYLGPISFYLAMLQILYMLGTRIRIIEFGKKYLRLHFPGKNYPNIVIYFISDLYARIISLIHILNPLTREEW